MTDPSVSQTQISVSSRQQMIRFGLILPAIVIALDQLTKFLATKAFGLPMSICKSDPFIEREGLHIEISPIADLGMLCNQGVSWGLLQDSSDLQRWALFAFALIMIGVLVSALKTAQDGLSRLSLGLLIGGAAGNAIDRGLFGAVTDFVDASDLGFRWVFNVADSAITVGVVLLILAMVREYWAERKAARG